MTMNVAKLISVAEKSRYPFHAYPKGPCRDLLFPGCAFPSQFPRTTDELSRVCRGLGMGVAYDCCGKPLEDWDEDASAGRVSDKLNARVARTGCERLVVVCPNCLDYLRERSAVPCVSVYQALIERGFEARAAFDPGVLFIPCPDRKSREIEGFVRRLADLSAVETLSGVPCCGLRADVAARGPEFVSKQGRRIAAAAAGRTVYTYCASCLGQFARVRQPDGGPVFAGGQVRHVLSAMLGVEEEPDASRAILNRARRRFDKNLEPGSDCQPGSDCEPETMPRASGSGDGCAR